MKKILTALALVMGTGIAVAQQDAQFTQNMFNKLAINPAFAGAGGGICATSLVRTQWVGFGNSPNTGLLSIDSPVKKLKGGVGGTILMDQLGNEQTFYGKFAYAYRQALGAGIVSAGIEAGFMQKSIKSGWSAPDGTDGMTDPSIPQGASAGTLDLGFGAQYTVPGKFFVGISSLHLNAGKLKDTKLNYTLARNYYIMGGYEYALNEQITLKPMAFVKTDFASLQMDLNCLAYYNNMFWGGLSYRMVDAVALLLGYQGKAGEKSAYKIGYSYDFTTSKIRTKSTGSHELMLSYCYFPVPKPKTTKYKNVRFL